MKPFVVAIAGAALLLICFNNPKQQKKQSTLSLNKKTITLSVAGIVRR